MKSTAHAKQAVQLYEKIRLQGGLGADELYKLGIAQLQAYLKNGRIDQVEKCLGEIGALKREDCLAMHQMRIKRLCLQGEIDQALDYLQKCRAELNERSIALSHLIITRAYALHRSPLEARDYLQKVSREVSLKNNLAESWAKLHRDVYRAVLKNKPSMCELRALRGVIMPSTGGAQPFISTGFQHFASSAHFGRVVSEYIIFLSQQQLDHQECVDQQTMVPDLWYSLVVLSVAIGKKHFGEDKALIGTTLNTVVNNILSTPLKSNISDEQQGMVISALQTLCGHNLKEEYLGPQQAMNISVKSIFYTTATHNRLVWIQNVHPMFIALSESPYATQFSYQYAFAVCNLINVMVSARPVGTKMAIEILRVGEAYGDLSQCPQLRANAYQQVIQELCAEGIPPTILLANDLLVSGRRRKVFEGFPEPDKASLSQVLAGLARLGILKTEPISNYQLKIRGEVYVSNLEKGEFVRKVDPSEKIQLRKSKR
jgi:hypothetical protein